MYAAGLVAALRLLPRRSSGWWAAAVSLPPIVVLGLLSGWYMLAPAGLAVVALAHRHLTTGGQNVAIGLTGLPDVPAKRTGATAR